MAGGPSAQTAYGVSQMQGLLKRAMAEVKS
jgi:hypothetical protein